MNMKNIWSRFTLIAIFFFSFAVYPVKANNISDTSPKPTGQPRGSETYQPGETGLSLHLAAATFDPLARLPLLPESLRYTEAEAILAGDYIVQFSSPVLPEWKEALVSLGVQLGDYIPDYAFLAHMDASTLQTASVYPFVRWIGAYQPAFKLARSIDLTEVRSSRILVAPWADAEALYKALSGFDGRTRNYGSGFSVVLNGEQVIQTARQPGVIWIEPYHLQSLHNDIAGGDIMGGSTAWSNGYTGTGIGIAVTDTGLDTGDPANIHLDF